MSTDTTTTDRGPLTYDGLVGTLFGAAAFQVLNAGCRLGLFDLLHARPERPSAEVAEALDLTPRATHILLQASTSLGLTVVERDRYRNADLVGRLIEDGTWEVLVDVVEFEAEIVYAAQADTVESLRTDTNVGLRRFPGEGSDLYHRLAGSPDLEKLFYRCMRSWSRLSNPVLVAEADLTGVRRVLDVGGGEGVNSIALARAHPDVEFTVLDLPGAVKIARENVEEEGLSDRVTAQEGDIFADRYPDGYDCVLFANQLVIWTPEQNLALLRAAHQALPDGGRVLVFNAMSNDSGDGPLYAALDNIYFATLPAGGSTLYRWEQYEQWLREAGFDGIERRPGRTWTPHGVISGRR